MSGLGMQLHESIKIMQVRTGTAQDTLRVASLHTGSWQAM